MEKLKVFILERGEGGHEDIETRLVIVAKSENRARNIAEDEHSVWEGATVVEVDTTCEGIVLREEIE